MEISQLVIQLNLSFQFSIPIRVYQLNEILANEFQK